MINEIFFILLPVIIYLVFFRINILHLFDHLFSFKHIVFSVIVGVSIFFVLNRISSFVEGFFDLPVEYIENKYQLLDELRRSGIVKAIIVVAAIPALCEELLFRGVILKGLLASFGSSISILTVSVLFALFHFDLYLLMNNLIAGIFLTIIAQRAGLLYAMIVHFINNILVYIIFIKPQWLPFIKITVDDAGYINDIAIPNYIIWGSVIVLSLSVVSLIRIRNVDVEQ